MNQTTLSAIRPNELTLREDAPAVHAAIKRVMDRGWFVLGPEVEAFEREFATAVGASYAIGVGNGTDAIAIALRAVGTGEGHEVITSPLSAAFSALGILMAGARPVFVDLDPERLTLDPARLEAAVTPRTRAIVPVHLYGQPADMAGILDVAGQHGLAIVEDACQAHLATYAGRHVGSIGIAGAFSFYPTKNLGALGDGGAVVTSDAQVAERARRLRNGGQSARYHHVEAGVNSRLDELQAAILRARLPLLQGWTARRRVLAGHYRRALADAPAVVVPPEIEPGHVYHLFPVLCDRREQLQAFLGERGIETLVHYPVPLPRQPALASARPAACPIADRVCTQVLSLPLHPGMREEDVSRVSMAVRAFGP